MKCIALNSHAEIKLEYNVFYLGGDEYGASRKRETTWLAEQAGKL